ncbi:MAG: hypothetical protein ABIJ09_17800 [Pseudomonadota bacterium]
MDLEHLTATSFRPHLNTLFVATQVNDLGLELIEVELLRGDDDRSFSLVFREAGPHSLGQGTYALSHPTLGELPLFLTPIIPDLQGRGRYESLFNRTGS